MRKYSIILLAVLIAACTQKTMEENSVKASQLRSVDTENSSANATRRDKCLIASDKAGTAEECQMFDKEQFSKNENRIKEGLADFNGDMDAFCYSSRLIQEGQSFTEDAVLKLCRENSWAAQNEKEKNTPLSESVAKASQWYFSKSNGKMLTTGESDLECVTADTTPLEIIDELTQKKMRFTTKETLDEKTGKVQMTIVTITDLNTSLIFWRTKDHCEIVVNARRNASEAKRNSYR